jgi:hypothetical protein
MNISCYLYLFMLSIICNYFRKVIQWHDLWPIGLRLGTVTKWYQSRKLFPLWHFPAC